SPRAALTGTRPATRSVTAATTSASATPSGPRAGSFTSIRSAPPASAASASSADRTLTSNPVLCTSPIGGRILPGDKHEPLRGNPKHEIRNPKQIQNPNQAE